MDVNSFVQELEGWARNDKGIYQNAKAKALDALAMLVGEEGLKIDRFQDGAVCILPATWSACDYPGYNAVGGPDWDLVPESHPASRARQIDVVFAPFSPNAPGRVGLGGGEKKSWIVARLWFTED